MIICCNAFDADDNYTDDPREIVAWSVYVRDTDIEFELETEAAAEAKIAELVAQYDTTDIRRF